MKILKAVNYIVIALFLIMYMLFDDIVPTLIDNGLAGLESLAMIVLAVKAFKDTVKN